MAERDPATGRFVRSAEALSSSMQQFERQVVDATKATKDETKAKKSLIGGLGKAGLAAGAGLAVPALVASLSNPHLSFGTSLTDLALGGLNAVGIGDVPGRQAINLAEQRTQDFAGRLGRGGREISDERIQRRLELETRRARLEVGNQFRVRGQAAQLRNQAAADELAQQFPEAVKAMQEVVHSLKELTNRLPGVGGR